MRLLEARVASEAKTGRAAALNASTAACAFSFSVSSSLAEPRNPNLSKELFGASTFRRFFNCVAPSGDFRGSLATCPEVPRHTAPPSQVPHLSFPAVDEEAAVHGLYPAGVLLNLLPSDQIGVVHEAVVQLIVVAEQFRRFAVGATGLRAIEGPIWLRSAVFPLHIVQEAFIHPVYARVIPRSPSGPTFRPRHAPPGRRLAAFDRPFLFLVVLIVRRIGIAVHVDRLDVRNAHPLRQVRFGPLGTAVCGGFEPLARVGLAALLLPISQQSREIHHSGLGEVHLEHRRRLRPIWLCVSGGGRGRKAKALSKGVVYRGFSVCMSAGCPCDRGTRDRRISAERGVAFGHLGASAKRASGRGPHETEAVKVLPLANAKGIVAGGRERKFGSPGLLCRFLEPRETQG
eukprot:scaffold1809_cov228-Pinguiococcus_pyrenoidosus.AAC.2